CPPACVPWRLPCCAARPRLGWAAALKAASPRPSLDGAYGPIHPRTQLVRKNLQWLPPHLPPEGESATIEGNPPGSKG
ncbi:MAG: hypothetical protein J7M05_06755, partial [Anaerolineae bacterium]|nr:hypothetical protein [Anaerolineae bacterium]